ncbi:Pyruvate kinase [hydrothermal vent metagenome]|uniref:Pyruvate kinase n=1 Tax=hydrothermal vent metagenome TaxID=652676 RepID=A0A3B1AAE4_9ZZZZ
MCAAVVAGCNSPPVFQSAKLIFDLMPLFIGGITMPKVKRVDINVIKGSMGVPIEIKGQWHDKVWDAPTAQLDELYTRDWRADGRGFYHVDLTTE